MYIYIYCINKCDANVYNEVRSESLSTSYLWVEIQIIARLVTAD